MTTIEILNAFTKGWDKVTISEKQKSWLLSQAEKEGLYSKYGGHGYVIIYLDDCHYQIKQCSTLASGGSYVGRRAIQGKYNLEKQYYIEFDNGFKRIASRTDIESYKIDGYIFKIISYKCAV